VTITDRLWQLEHDLDRDEGPLDALSRRMLLRKAMDAVAADARQEGYHDGQRDVLDSQNAERERADAGAAALPGPEGEQHA
jgi:hypothetical protein